jgi:hypothetical protein
MTDLVESLGASAVQMEQMLPMRQLSPPSSSSVLPLSPSIADLAMQYQERAEAEARQIADRCVIFLLDGLFWCLGRLFLLSFFPATFGTMVSFLTRCYHSHLFFLPQSSFPSLSPLFCRMRKLEAEQADWARQLEKLQRIHSAEKIKIDVGGKLFSISRSHLTKSAYFTALLSSSMQGSA